jgi:hypothetical protein
LATTVAWGPSPLSTQYRKGYWPLEPDSRLAAKKAAMAAVPSGAPVSATYYFVPHLTHRKQVYDFPEPWKAVNWGIKGEGLHDPARVEWLVVDRTLFNEYEGRLVNRLLDGEFRVRYEQDGIVAAQREGPLRNPS